MIPEDAYAPPKIILGWDTVDLTGALTNTLLQSDPDQAFLSEGSR